jgi:hypothetical protein
MEATFKKIYFTGMEIQFGLYLLQKNYEFLSGRKIAHFRRKLASIATKVQRFNNNIPFFSREKELS